MALICSQREKSRTAPTIILVTLLPLFIVHQWFIQGVQCVSVQQDLTLTRQEKIALDRFKQRVSHRLPEPYMRDDIYLIRWLRATNLNVVAAETILIENLKWRNANNMTTIHQEDWSDLQEEYPYFVDTFDKEGRPVVTLKFGEWDVRRAILTSRGRRLTRYLYKVLDEATTKVRALQQQGKLVTQWTAILDLDGYSLSTHGCLQCLPIYINYVTSYEAYFPGTQHDIILINTPAIFETVLRVMRPLMRESTRNILHVFGTNRNQWKRYLLQNVDAGQLERHFGGKKNDRY